MSERPFTGAVRQSLAFFALFVSFVVVLLAFSNVAQAAYRITSLDADPSSLQAAGHPKAHVSLTPDAAYADSNGGDDLRSVAIDYPAGLLINPLVVTTRCTSAQFSAGTCPSTSAVGALSVKWRGPLGSPTSSGTVYAMATAAGSDGTFAASLSTSGYRSFTLTGDLTSLAASRTAADAAYGMRLNIGTLPRTLQTSLLGLSINATASNLTFDAGPRATTSSTGPFLVTNPTRCSAATTRATAATYASLSVAATDSFTPTGCGSVLFTPTLATTLGDATAGAASTIGYSFTQSVASQTIQQSHVRALTIDLAAGSSLNSAALSGVTPCGILAGPSDTCPDSSKIGTASASTPLLGAGLTGDVYAMQLSPLAYRVVLRGATGQLSFDGSASVVSGHLQLKASEMPQIPFSALQVSFLKSLVLNSTSCAAGTVTRTATGWSGASATSSSSVTPICSPPETTITAGPTGPVANPAPTFTFTSDKSGATFACALDSAGYSPCTSPYTLPTTADGDHVFCVRATAGGQTDPTPACRTFTIDTHPPTITIVSPPPNYTTENPSVVVNYTVSEPSTCSLPNGGAVALAIGVNTISVTCTDAAGNAGIATVAVVRTQHVDPPNPICDASGGTITCTWTGGSGFVATCAVDNVARAACTSPLVITGLPPGPHTITICFTDQAGNTSCRNWTFTIVDDQPFITITSPANGSTTTLSSIPVIYTVANSPGAICNPASGSSVPLNMGSNTIVVQCTSVSGNVGTRQVSVTRVVPAFTPTFNRTLSSTTAPAGVDLHWDVTNATGAEGIRRIIIGEDPQVAPNFAGYGPPSTYMCPISTTTLTTFNPSGCPASAVVGTATFTSSNYPAPITGTVYAIDKAVVPFFGISVDPSTPGNPAGLSIGVVVRTSIPQVDPLCDPTDTDANPFGCPSHVVFSAQDFPNFGLTGLSLDIGGLTTPPVSGVDPHLFKLQPDPGQCTGSVTATATFTGWSASTFTASDTDPITCPPPPPTAPSISITSPTSPWTQLATTTLIYTVNPGSGDTPVCSIPSGSTIPLNDGPNSIVVTCTNSAGSTTRTVQITRDFHPPVITITSPAPGAYYTTVPGPNLAFTVTDDWDPAPTCNQTPGPISTVNQGANVVTVTCTDHAGNSSSASRTFFFDNIVPTVGVTCSPHDSNSPTCTVSVSEASVTLTCSVNNSTPTPCTSPVNPVGTIVDALNTLRVCATDPAGNTGCGFDTFGTTMPGQAQITQFADPSAPSTSAQAISFSPSAAECRVDAGTWSSCISPWTVPTGGLSSPAEHTYEVRAPGQVTAPARGYIWLDDRQYNATATVTPQANTLASASTAATAGAHPDIAATIAMQGADDVKSAYVQFPDGLMGSLSSVPAGSRCSTGQAAAGTCPLSSQIGTITATMEFANSGTITANGSIYMVDSTGLASQYAAGAAISIKNIQSSSAGPLGDINSQGFLTIVDNGRALRLEATDLPRQTSTNARFHLLAGTATVKGDTGGSANPLVTNPHYCGAFNANRKSPGSPAIGGLPAVPGVPANNFWGQGTSYQGTTTPEIHSQYSVTGCSSVPFTPTITASLSSTAAASSTTLNTTVSFGTDNSPLRTAIVRLPSFVAPNLAAFGDVSNDQCPTTDVSFTAGVFGTAAAAYSKFTPLACPASAIVGKAILTSPLLPGTVTADVYQVNKAPIPNLGVYVDPNKYGNPQGVTIGLYGTTTTPQVDPLCDPTDTDTNPLGCPSQIAAQFASIPDVPVTSMAMTVGGIPGRTLSSGQVFPNVLNIAQAADPACVNAGGRITSTLNAWSGPVATPQSNPLLPTGCNQ